MCLSSSFYAMSELIASFIGEGVVAVKSPRLKTSDLVMLQYSTERTHHHCLPTTRMAACGTELSLHDYKRPVHPQVLKKHHQVKLKRLPNL